MEHNLGLTCDPIDGLVQVPCIVSEVTQIRHSVCSWESLQERNSLGGESNCVMLVALAHIVTAVKAVTAGQLAMASDGVYSVTLDEVIEAMKLTAADMSVKYKETSLSVSR